MTRIAFVTDQHFDIHSRFEETIRIHQWIADDAAAQGCSLTLLGGDMYERKSVAEERNAVGDWLIQLANFGPVVGVYGNHESQFDLDIFNLLEAPNAIRFHDRPAIDIVEGVAIACLPWPRKSSLLAEHPNEGREEVNNLAQHHLRNILRGLGAELDVTGDGMPRVLLAHVMIDGATTDHEQPIVGSDMALSLADLALARADFYACGHVHAQQEQLIYGAPCIYGGAPRHNNFGEPGPKGYVVIEFDGPRLVAWERRATPAAPMRLLSVNWSASGLVLEKAAQVSGAEVRLRYSTPSDTREAARAAALNLRDSLLSAGALMVKLEERVITVSRSRTPEIASALKLDDKLRALWQSQKEPPSGDRIDGLLAKVLELEEVANAT